MADLIDQEAKRRGVSRAALMANYQRQMEMRGQNGVGGASGAPAAQPRPAAPKPKVDNRSALQRLLDALG